MKEILKLYVFPALYGVLTGILIELLINLPSCLKEPKVIVEYIEKHDTITVEKERIVRKTKIEYIDKVDTFYVKESGDTVQLDSLPITEYRYLDTIKTDSTSTEITVDYHGFSAGIDNINLVHNYYLKQTTIVKEPKKVGIVWFVGVSAGYSAHGSINTGTFGHGPSVLIGAGIGIGGRIK